ncbi:hypothetical protein GOQ27_02735 [Clostridium sp. D2Q-11]|uniref:Uncharacterized protein n=1 Tax=Anaeromonas frigoriresistens TaxID=2683708 RepID=A0A942UQD1_9FIRM|nr:hypothetical protein [Anaeromonas frigoriresistens]MBS4537359.1 hypothetical protein [Anaeromonas frigoriresistens]
MKKLLSIAIVGIVLMASSNSVFAANNISNMAVSKGGQHVVQCAQHMDKGISDCVQMVECEM